MSNLRIAELDFDTIKTNLKTFLQSQDQFTDYDFEGSSLSVLLDILAYNTHYNAFLANMLMNEMFLDSSVKFSSAVSIAKHLGYTPRSVRSSIASLNLVVSNPTNTPPTIYINKYTQFLSTINGASYTFSTIKDYVAERSGATYTFNNVEVVEGTVSSFTYVVADPSSEAKYEIPATNIDTTTLTVSVQNSVSDTTSYVYNLATDITNKNSNSKIYFLELSPLGKYQFNFGDGIIGKQLSEGNIINITYLRSSGTVTNVSSTVSQSFSLQGTIAGSNDVVITTVSNSTGAKDAETINSIKFNAPKVNAAKNRAVTAEDYEALILANYSGAESVAVWGGEDNDPPIYGKVLVSLKPASGFSITQVVKDNIKNNILKNKKIIALDIDFVDPSYIYVSSTSSVSYDTSLTSVTQESLKNSILSNITSFFSSNLNKFNKKFYYSKLIKTITDTNSAILNVVTTIKLQRRLTPSLGVKNSFINNNSVKFRNPVKPTGITSSYFYVTINGITSVGKIADLPDDVPASVVGTGTLRVLSIFNNSVLVKNVGSINYSTGELVLSDFTPTSYPTNVVDLRINAEIQEAYYNIEVAKNEIILQDNTTALSTGGYNTGTIINVTPVIE